MVVNKTLQINLTKEESTTLREAFNILDEIAGELTNTDVDFFTLAHGDTSSKLERQASRVFDAHECLDMLL
jgi:hypothetical protein